MKNVYIEYQYQLGRANGKVAYIMRWEDNNIGKKCNETGMRGQIFFDRGERIKQMEKKGFTAVYTNYP